jgi:hypothetical protein
VSQALPVATARTAKDQESLAATTWAEMELESPVALEWARTAQGSDEATASVQAGLG